MLSPVSFARCGDELDNTLNMYLPPPASGSCQGTWQKNVERAGVTREHNILVSCTKSVVHSESSPVKHIVLSFSWNY